MELTTTENILKLVSKHLAINDDKVYLMYNEIKEEKKDYNTRHRVLTKLIFQYLSYLT
jgi:hypothetical protein